MLDGEASKLFETFSALKNQQKGFLSNLVKKDVIILLFQNSIHENTNTSNNMKNFEKTNTNSPNIGNSINNIENNNTNNSDTTLSDIEKQISLLSSLNASNSK